MMKCNTCVVVVIEEQNGKTQRGMCGVAGL